MNIRIALFEPRIPQNTGNIARTCAAFKIPLDLIEPLGFSLNDKYLKRAGLDYWKYIDLHTHNNFKDFSNRGLLKILTNVIRRFLFIFKKTKNYVLSQKNYFAFDKWGEIHFSFIDPSLPENHVFEAKTLP